MPNKLQVIGLISGQNPDYKKQDDDANKAENKELRSRIEQLGLETFPTYYFGEDGFLVPGISKKILIDLGREFQQKAVIWGKRVEEDKNGMTFNWQYIEDGKVRGEKISHHPFVVPEFS